MKLGPGPVPVLPLGIPVSPAGPERVLLSSPCSPPLLVPPSTGDWSQLMLLNYRPGLAIIISRDCEKRGEFWLICEGCRERCHAQTIGCVLRLWWVAGLRTAGQSRERVLRAALPGACGRPPGLLRLHCPSPLWASRHSPSFQAVAKPPLLMSFLMQSGECVIAGPGDVSKSSNPEGKLSLEYFIVNTTCTA